MATEGEPALPAGRAEGTVAQHVFLAVECGTPDFVDCYGSIPVGGEGGDVLV